MSSTHQTSTDTDVFVYTGDGGAEVPDDVVRVLVDPSVTSIPANAFCRRNKLTEVELCEGLVEIGEGSFRWCGSSITKIIIPTSLRRIRDDALHGSLRCPIRLHDGIESIGAYAFSSCIFTNFRVPPLITMIPFGMLHNIKSIFFHRASRECKSKLEVVHSAVVTVYVMWPFLQMLILVITSFF